MSTERRRHQRQILRVPVRAAAAGERPLPTCGTIDVSEGGVLLAFDDPASFGPGVRLLLTLMLSSGRCHMIGAVRRVARGTDFRTYVAVELETRWPEEAKRLRDHLDVERSRASDPDGDPPGRVLNICRAVAAGPS